MEKIKIHVFLRILIVLTIFLELILPLSLNFKMFVAFEFLSITLKLPIIEGLNKFEV